TITRNGDTTQGTFSPFSQTGWGAYFDGSNDFLTAPDDAAWTIDADYTIEFWAYATSFPGTFNQVITHTVPGSNLWWAIYWNTSSGWAFEYNNGSSATITSRNQNTPLNNWVHFAVVKSGTTGYIFLNGQQAGATFTFPTVVDNSAPLRIGTWSGSSDFWNGYISNMRIVKGRAVYTSNFTPPILPLGKTSGGTNPPQGTETKLLTLQSNRFVDNSDSALVLTPTNGVAITPFSPFAPTSSYSAAAVGGSGYFDGSGDYLTVPDSTALDLPGDFTIECWLYRTANTNNTILYTIGNYSGSNNGFTLYVEAGNNLRCYGNGGFIFTGTAGLVPLNAWVHIALIRSGSGSNNMKAYINGVLDTASQASNNSSWTGVAGNGFSPGAFYDGTYNAQTEKTYMAGMRLVKGQALASGDFTPPTTPVTISSVGWTGANAAGSLTGTISLLLNFTNAGVVDATAKNVLETEGNAQISTAQSKYPTASLTNGGIIDMRSGAASSTGLLIRQGDGSSSGTTIQCFLGNTASTTPASQTGLSINAWNYIAVVRDSSNDLRVYINGSAGSAVSRSIDLTDTNCLIGAFNGATSSPNATNGYIDDLRITRGVARTVTTSPSGPFPVQ
ncbi:hypothetical protein EBZ38_15660, partial [bacterium]|nr:hypothetical protein [bacterium]